jgi:hypothetical protein
MARIRSVKPDFFRHEVLQDLEIAHPGSYPMMVFAGLWGHCDSKGRFEWRPRQLKLDILPFLAFDMADTLGILEQSGMVKRYSVEGKEYGEVPTFEKHQRLSGKEATDGEKHPNPISEAMGKQRGGAIEIQESQEGKGREEEGKGNGEGGASPPKSPKRATTLADDFQPNGTGIQYAAERRLCFDDELIAFRNWHSAKGTTFKDWQAAWRTWCDKAVEFGRSGTKQNGVGNGKNGSRQSGVAGTIAELTGANRIPGGDAGIIDGEARRVD